MHAKFMDTELVEALGWDRRNALEEEDKLDARAGCAAGVSGRLRDSGGGV
ncbi:MAG: hypothetical protein U9Q70_06865 [Chloroflexota bacterium]|nr:hypothetical protein [Chloroflexota bacterium]